MVSMIAMSLLLGACGKDEVEGPSVSAYEQERAKLAARLKSGQPKVKKPDAEKEGESDGTRFGAVARGYEYTSAGKRDPFRSFILEVAQERRDARGPLEQFDLAQLELKAVLWGTEAPRALVADPSGRGYIVREGTLMGKNEGKVVRIGDNAVVVKEVYVDYFGDSTTKNVTMQVRAPKEGEER